MFLILSALIFYVPTVASTPLRNTEGSNPQPSSSPDSSISAKKVVVQSSLLDALPTTTSSKANQPAVGALPSTTSLLIGRRLAKRLHNLPPCQRQCVQTLSDIIGDVLDTSSYIEKYQKTCSAYKEAKVCVLKQQRLCNESGEMFTVVASGIQYMCVEQRKAFVASIECIEHNAFSVQAVCEFHCHIRESLLDIIAESAFSQPFGNLLRSLRGGSLDIDFGETYIPLEADLYQFPEEPAGNPLGTANSEVMEMLDSDWTRTFKEFEYISGKACQQAECALMCIKGEYDRLCGNYTGTLIAESIVRPMALGMQKFPPAFLVLGSVLPNSCKFLSSGTRMMRHRMDTETNTKLLRQFGTINEEEFLTTVGEESSEQSNAWGSQNNERTELLTFGDAQVDRQLDREGLAEGSGGTSKSVKYRSEFSVSSIEELGRRKIVFRKVLSDVPYYDFTTNITGTLHCQIIRELQEF